MKLLAPGAVVGVAQHFRETFLPALANPRLAFRSAFPHDGPPVSVAVERALRSSIVDEQT
jgi:hypothetical protein